MTVTAARAQKILDPRTATAILLLSLSMSWCTLEYSIIIFGNDYIRCLGIAVILTNVSNLQPFSVDFENFAWIDTVSGIRMSRW
jgi:hypothetical protein